MKIVSFASTLMSMAAIASSSAAIIIANPSFEADSLADAPDDFTNNTITSWAGATSSAFNHGAVDPASGSAAEAQVTGENSAYMVGTSFISQNVSVTADINVGDQVTFSFDAWRNNGTTNIMTIAFAGLSPQVVDLGTGANDGTPNDIVFTATSTIPTGTALLRFDHTGSGAQSRLDNITAVVTPIPEPTSSVLLGISGLTLLLRRRK